MCPGFAERFKDQPICCSDAQIKDLNEKFESVYQTFFQDCPACLRSQLEYYCEMYCHPEQSDFIEVSEVFESTIPNQNKFGIQKFTAKVPSKFLNDIYDNCKTVKQKWFSNVDSIPIYSTTVVENKFCKDTTNCNGEHWLNAQGLANGTWPRMGVLNEVKIFEDSKFSSDVYSCDRQDILVYPVNSTVTKSCECFNCVKECLEPDDVSFS